MLIPTKSYIIISIFLLSFSKCNNSIKKNQTFKKIVVEKCESPMSVNVGDTLIVKLEEYPGRGFSWQIVKDSNLREGIKFLGKSDSNLRNPTDGSSKIVLFELLMLQSNSYILNFEYKRPWEKTKPPTQTCQLTVKVQ